MTGPARPAAAVGPALLVLAVDEGADPQSTDLSTHRTGTVRRTRTAVLAVDRFADTVSATLATVRRAGVACLSEQFLAFSISTTLPAVPRASVAVLVRIAVGVPTPGHVYAGIHFARVVSGTGPTRSSATIRPARLPLASREGARSGRAGFPAYRAATISRTGAAVLAKALFTDVISTTIATVTGTGLASLPVLWLALAVSAAHPAVCRAGLALFARTARSISAPGDVHTRVPFAGVVLWTGAAGSAAAVVPALLPVAGREDTGSPHTLLSTRAAGAIRGTGSAVLSGIAGLVAAVGHVDALVTLTHMVGSAGSAAPAAPIVPALLPLTGREYTGTGDTRSPTPRAGTVRRTGAAVLRSIAGSVPAPGDVHALTVLAHEMVCTGATVPSAAVGPALLPFTCSENAPLARTAGLPTATGTIRRTGVAVLPRTAGAITAARLGLTHTAHARMEGRAGSTHSTTAVGTALPSLTGSEHTSTRLTLPATTAHTVCRTTLAVLPGVAGSVPTELLRNTLPTDALVGCGTVTACAATTVVTTFLAATRSKHTLRAHTGLATPGAGAVGNAVPAVLPRPAGPIATTERQS